MDRKLRRNRIEVEGEIDVGMEPGMKDKLD